MVTSRRSGRHLEFCSFQMVTILNWIQKRMVTVLQNGQHFDLVPLSVIFMTGCVKPTKEQTKTNNIRCGGFVSGAHVSGEHFHSNFVRSKRKVTGKITYVKTFVKVSIDNDELNTHVFNLDLSCLEHGLQMNHLRGSSIQLQYSLAAAGFGSCGQKHFFRWSVSKPVLSPPPHRKFRPLRGRYACPRFARGYLPGAGGNNWTLNFCPHESKFRFCSYDFAHKKRSRSSQSTTLLENWPTVKLNIS